MCAIFTHPEKIDVVLISVYLLYTSRPTEMLSILEKSPYELVFEHVSEYDTKCIGPEELYFVLIAPNFV